MESHTGWKSEMKELCAPEGIARAHAMNTENKVFLSVILLSPIDQVPY
jgi:hypothetical protein